MSYSIQEINLEGVSPEQVQYLANLIESSKHHDANLVNKGEVPKLQQLVLNKCLSTIADDNENEVFVQSCPNNDSISDVPNSYYMIVSASGEDNHEMYHGAEMDIERLALQRTNQSYTQDPCMASADTSFGEENILDHLTRQVAMQQQYLCNAMNIVPTGMDSSSRCYSDNDSFISQDPNYNAGEPQGLNDSLNGSLMNSGFAVPQYPVTSLHQPVIQLHSTPENNPGREKNLVLIRSENMETPENHHHTAVTSQGCYVYTPHPRTGQLLYMTATDDGSPQLYQPLPQVTATPIPPTQKDKSIFTTPKTTNCTLNSSGEETQESPSSGDPPTDKSSTTDVSSTSDGSTSLLSSTLDKNNNKFYDISLFSSCVGEDGREQHNMKERRRRARIKDACDVLRKLVPGMSDKTDKATVFEFAARYVHFLKGFVGNQHDKDFLLKYSPY
ncbi:uncharacterized protein LOC133197014 [Saccostrea echinata]|uniref:uncharacterized protein LOC133197014 n=1 Tax=Saccostrea echinata TaxID=191078 RepID=UPI002A82CCE6|nr:uncharacterized protein LOC133197014 [Saccostrea echinata]